jgi:hypothetical protein
MSAPPLTKPPLVGRVLAVRSYKMRRMGLLLHAIVHILFGMYPSLVKLFADGYHGPES